MSSKPHILVVDDEEDILSLLEGVLKKHGHPVSLAINGTQMFEILAHRHVDLIVLDIMMHGDDGLTLCRRIRATSNIPIIMLTAMSDHTDKVVGLEIGADDYLVKPFDPRELLARINAVLRRASRLPLAGSTDTQPVILFTNWRLNVARRELRSTDDTLMILSGAEFDLLLAFVEHPQRILTRDQLLDFAHGDNHSAFDRSIDVQVSRLRRKLETDPRDPEIIKTVRNEGYIFTPPISRV